MAKVLQFRLRSLLVAVAVASVLLSCVPIAEWHDAYVSRQNELKSLRRLNGLGVQIGRKPLRAHPVFGYFKVVPGEVNVIDARGTAITDNDLRLLAHFRCLEMVGLAYTDITDTGLLRIAHIPTVKEVLVTDYQRISEVGVMRLRQMRPDINVTIGIKTTRFDEELVPWQRQYGNQESE